MTQAPKEQTEQTESSNKYQNYGSYFEDAKKEFITLQKKSDLPEFVNKLNSNNKEVVADFLYFVENKYSGYKNGGKALLESIEKDKSGAYNGFLESDSILNDLKKISSIELSSFIKKRETLGATFLKYYKIPDKYKAKLTSSINSLDEVELNDLLRYNARKKREDFLKKHFSTEITNKEIIPVQLLDCIQKISQSGSFSGLSDEIKSSIRAVYNRNQTVLQSDIYTIVKNLPNNDLKKEFLSFVKPTISLEELVNYGIITKENAFIRARKIIKQSGFDEKTVNSLEDNSIDLKNYIVDINGFLDDRVIKFIFNDRKEDDESEMYSLFQEFNEELKEEKKAIGPQSFKELKKELLHKIENIDLFTSGNYLEVITKDDSGNQTITYLQVGRVDLYGENSFELRLVGENGVFLGYSFCENNTINYKQFIDNFGEEYTIKAVNNDYLQNLIGNGNLKLRDGLTDFLPNERLEAELEIENIDAQIAKKRKQLTDKYGEFGLTDQELDNYIYYSQKQQELQRVSDFSQINEYISTKAILGYTQSQEFNSSLQTVLSNQAGYLLEELNDISYRLSNNFFHDGEKDRLLELKKSLNDKVLEIEQNIYRRLVLNYLLENENLSPDEQEKVKSFLNQLFLKSQYDKVAFLSEKSLNLDTYKTDLDSSISFLENENTPNADFLKYLRDKKAKFDSISLEDEEINIELSNHKKRIEEIEQILLLNRKKELEKKLGEEISLEERLKIEGIISDISQSISSKPLNVSLDSILDINSKKDLEKELEVLNQIIGFSSGFKEFLDVKNKLESVYSNNLKASLEEFSSLYQKRNNLEKKLETAGEDSWSKLIMLLDNCDNQGAGIKNTNGESGLFVGMLIQDFDDSDKINTYRVIGVDKKEGFVTIISEVNGIVEKLSFDDFAMSFKDAACKRSLPYGVEYFLSEMQKTSSSWGNYIFKGNGFYLKTDNQKEKKDGEPEATAEEQENNGSKLEYLKNNNGEVIKIEKVSGDVVTVTFGKYGEDSTKDIKDHHSGEVESKYSEVSLSSTSQTMSFSALKRFLDLKGKEKYEPTHEFKNKPPKYKREYQLAQNPFGYYLKHFVSIKEIGHGFQQVGKSIEHLLEKNEHVHSSHFALMLGHLIPIEEVQSTLKVDVESAEEEAMRKEVKGLSSVDSPIATARIKKWLKSPTSMDYQKEAGVIFMLEKYGELYAKELAGEKGKFLWYKALGGFVPDQLFNDVEKECRDLDVAFDEKVLVHRLLKRQCKGHGYRGVHRRSRLHKEYEGAWKKGEKEEYEKGRSDGAGYSTTIGRLIGGLSEMYGGTIPNSIGWLTKVLEKGGTIEELSEGFFTLIASGVLYGESNNVFNMIKGIWTNEHVPMVLARFSGSISDIRLVNDTVLELSKDISKIYDFPNLEKDAMTLYKNSTSTTISEEKRVKFAQKFWKKYGKVYSRALNMTNQASGTDQYGKVDKIIYVKGQEDPDSVYGRYFNRVGNFTEETNFKEGYINDGFVGTGISGLNMVRVAGMYFKFTETGSLKNGDAAKNFWKEYSHSVDNAIYKYQNREEAITYLKKDLGSVIKKLVQNHSGSHQIKQYNDVNTLFGPTLNRWGINIEDISIEGADNYVNSSKFSTVIANIVDKKPNHTTPSDEVSSVGGAVSSLLGKPKVVGKGGVNRSIGRGVNNGKPNNTSTVSPRNTRRSSKTEDGGGTIIPDDDDYGDVSFNISDILGGLDD